MQIKDQIQTLGTAPEDQAVEKLEALRVVALKKAVMQRNSNGVEAGAMQERDVVPRYIVVAVLLPECSGRFRSKEFQHQGANLTGRLRATFEQPHVAFRHEPVTQIRGAKEERFTGGVDDLFVVGVCELRGPLGNQSQEKKGQLQESELGHDFSAECRQNSLKPKLSGGEGGIRTPDTLSGMPVFKTGAINRSATSQSFIVLLQAHFYREPVGRPRGGRAGSQASP